MNADPFFGGGDPQELAPGTLFVPSFANVVAFDTRDGIVLVDTALRQLAPAVHSAVREWTASRLHSVVYTHGHVDHSFGLEPWLTEDEPVRIVAHERVPARFRRYARMKGLNEHINRVQFGVEDVSWPTTFFWPDVTYRDALTLVVGGERFELRHALGETDDATWVWAPERGVLCAGDFWIGCVPNCGNPQKVQRYPEEWAAALMEMASLGAEVLLPGHGLAITGTAEVRQALTDAAAYLTSIVDQTLAALNEGLTHEQVVARVVPPAELGTRPYLQAVYDRPEFIVRNLIRLHAGWWDGMPSALLPAPAGRRAEEIASLCGGVPALVRRAREIAVTDLPLACHLAEWAALADPDAREAHECVRDIFSQRARSEPSLMGRGIFMHAVRTAERRLAELDRR